MYATHVPQWQIFTVYAVDLNEYISTQTSQHKIIFVYA